MIHNSSSGNHENRGLAISGIAKLTHLRSVPVHRTWCGRGMYGATKNRVHSRAPPHDTARASIVHTRPFSHYPRSHARESARTFVRRTERKSQPILYSPKRTITLVRGVRNISVREGRAGGMETDSSVRDARIHPRKKKNAKKITKLKKNDKYNKNKNKK